MRAGGRVPNKIANAPSLCLGLQIYLDAWFDLNSCRPAGMNEGPIPWTQVEDYGRSMELSQDTLDDLHHHIREMDMEYFSFKKRKQGNA